MVCTAVIMKIMTLKMEVNKKHNSPWSQEVFVCNVLYI